MARKQNIGVYNADKREKMIKTLESKINKIIDELSFLQREKDEESLIRMSELTQQRDRLLFQLEQVSLAPGERTNVRNKVEVGRKVTLKNGRQKVKVSLVGEYEVNSSEGHISSVSPLGRQLMNRKVGDKFSVRTPAGVQEFQVMDIN